MLKKKHAWWGFFAWIVLCLLLAVFRRDEIWALVYVHMLVYSLCATIYLFWKAKVHKSTFKGKVFGIIAGFMLFSFLSQVSWVLLRLLSRFETIDSYIPHELFSLLFVNFTRGIAILFGIFLLVKYIKASDIELNWKKHVAWVFVSIIMLVVIDVMFLHPMLMQIVRGSSIILVAKSVADLFCPVMNIILLLFSIWLFIAFSSDRKASTTLLGISIASLIDLIYVSIQNAEYYSQDLSIIFGFGYVILFLVIGKYAAKQYNLSKSHLEILQFLKTKEYCIKTDITKRFGITRMTTNARLRALRAYGLILEQKKGRSRQIMLSKSGMKLVTG